MNQRGTPRLSSDNHPKTHRSQEIAMSLAGLSRWCYRRRRLVVASWVVAFVVLNAVGGAVGDAYTDNFSGGKSDSIEAFDLLKERFPARAGDTADIVFTAPKGVASPDVRAAMEALFAKA